MDRWSVLESWPPPTADPEREVDEATDLIARIVGGPRERARERARRLLAERELASLARSSTHELAERTGLGPSSVDRLAAALSLARRLRAPNAPRRPTLRTPRRVYDLLRPRVAGLEQEAFLTLHLDAKHRLAGLRLVSVGTLTTSLVHPREVFRDAIRRATAALIVAHNHPSGDPEPSREDLAVTRRLLSAADLLGIPLLDHVILGATTFVSMRERIDFTAVGDEREALTQGAANHT